MSAQPDGLRIDTTTTGSGPVVRVTGEVDLRTSPQLRRQLLQLLEQRPQRLVVDLSQVGYMDSSGVGTMVEIKRRIERDGGEVILSGLQTRVRSIFEITQLDKFFRIVPSADEVSGR